MKKSSQFCLNKKKALKALKELYTFRDILRWGLTQFQQAPLFYGHGTDNAWDEIVYLVLATLKLGPELNSMWLGARLTIAERLKIFNNIIKRINHRVPTAYLVNESWFSGLSFYVDDRVLIPRSSIAELIKQRFTPWINPDNVQAILDLGTGSACIAIAAAYEFPNAKIDAVDCSAEALKVASLNVEKHQCADQVKLIHSFNFEKLEGRCYDIIVSNPPYLDDNDFSKLPPEYRHEPAIALEAGRDGLDIIVQLLKQAKQYLKEGGLLIIEVGNSKPALIRRFPSLPFIWLSFECGDAEVFLLTQEQLTNVEEI